MSDILAKLRQGVTYKFDVPIRGLIVPLRPLTCEEHSHVVDALANHLKKLPDSSRHKYNENIIFAKYVLVRATTPHSRSKDEEAFLSHIVLGEMTNDEIALIYDEYIKVTEKVDPKLSDISVERIQELIELVKKRKHR